MYSKITVSSLLLAVPAALAQSSGTGSCTDVHIFIARGWNEPYPGRQGTLVSDICGDLSGLSCDYEDVIYDAASTDYCPSVFTGDNNGIAQIQSYYAKCPDTTLVVSGYSEGANIMGDILSGGTCGTFTGLATTSGASCNIAAALLFGDPHHMPYQSYNVLNGTAGQGEAGARSDDQKATLDSYTPRLRSYCQYDDLVCATGLGADTVEAHTNYFDYYSQDAASWAAGLVKSFQKGQYCSAATTSASSSAAASTSASSGSVVETVATTTSCTSGLNATSAPVYTAAPSTVTFYSTKEITITSCAATVTDCPARSTAVSTTYYPVSTTVIIPTAPVYWSTGIKASSSSAPASSTTTIGGKPAVVAYSTCISTTTLWNFPTISVTKTYPVATSYAGSYGWGNGTVATATGVVPAAGTGSGSWSSATPSVSSPATYTGAANSVKAAGWLVGAVGAVGMMLL